MRALLSVYDKTGLVELRDGPGGARRRAGRLGRHLARAARGGRRPPRRRRRSPARPRCSAGASRRCTPRSTAASSRTAPSPSTSPTSPPTGIAPIDLVVCNLYPFSLGPLDRDDRRRAARRWCAPRRRTTRTSASSWTRPTTTRPRRAGRDGHALGDDTARALARKAFAHTAAYDAAIVAWLDEARGRAERRRGAARDGAPHPRARRVAALRREPPPARARATASAGAPSWWDGVTQHAGCRAQLPQPLRRRRRVAAGPRARADCGPGAAVIIKHANACGAAVAADLAEAFRRGARGRPDERLRRDRRDRRRRRRRGRRARSPPGPRPTS